jgi:hypothetical protein
MEFCHGEHRGTKLDPQLSPRSEKDHLGHYQFGVCGDGEAQEDTDLPWPEGQALDLLLDSVCFAMTQDFILLLHSYTLNVKLPSMPR